MTNSILSLPDSDQPDLLTSLAQEFKEAFEELSGHAQSELSGKHFVFSRYGKELYPYFESTDSDLAPGCIVPLKEGRPVASVDSTCVLVGETPKGALYAARTAVGLSFDGKLRRFFRLGPLLVYASPDGLEGIPSGSSSPEMQLLLSDHTVAERVIRNLVEERVIRAIMEEGEEVTVLSDGSLKHPMGAIHASSARNWRAGNTLVGFSKSSGLIFSERLVGALSKCETPSYYLVDGGPIDSVLAKFSPQGLVFRLDVPRRGVALERVLGSLLWNDAFSSGYPESLKVAHHLSIFSKADDQALKAFVMRRFGLRQVPAFPVRRIALGGFRGGA